MDNGGEDAAVGGRYMGLGSDRPALPAGGSFSRYFSGFLFFFNCSPFFFGVTLSGYFVCSSPLIEFPLFCPRVPSSLLDLWNDEFVEAFGFDLGFCLWRRGIGDGLLLFAG